ncbi:hypothetical protein CS542_01485 [Pedobacter sp. IW39]|nr:hypothetical protein CS542_01485 [Pedobacter sp. IW39]
MSFGHYPNDSISSTVCRRSNFSKLDIIATTVESWLVSKKLWLECIKSIASTKPSIKINFSFSCFNLIGIIFSIRL